MTFTAARIPRCFVSSLLRNSTRNHEVLTKVASRQRFWEPDHKGGYASKIKKSPNERIREGMSQLGTEFHKLKQEASEKVLQDPILDIQHGDHELTWKFDNEEVMNTWTVTCDSDHNEGQSKAEFILGKNKTAFFQGSLNTELPKDGITKQAGYVNIKSPRNRRSFHRFIPYNWTLFTHLMMRVRGDGRAYLIVLQMDRYFDVQWHDQYHYMLYTRGGPYWQDVKIPFSKFYLAGKGRVQDKQSTLVDQLDSISFLGITLGDDNPGPFNLEIEYIGPMYDSSHKEKFAYEMYECSPTVHS